MKFLKKPLLILCLSVFVFSCTKTTDTTTPTNQYLVSNTEIGTFTKEQLATRYLANAGTQILAALVLHPIKVYKIVYKTKNSDGTEIQASGCLIVPTPTDKTLSFPMVSEQHGTITTDADAPSYYGAGGESNLVGSLIATQGFIAAFPDYIGFGTSNNVPHPYIHRATMASSSLDMIRACGEFIKSQGINWNNKLMVAGYSEGGYATMALQKKIEEEASTEFNLVASSCGAGPYNVSGFIKYLINEKSSGLAGNNLFYLWVLTSYNRIYGLNRPMSSYLIEPYATRVQANVLTANVTVSLNTIINPTFQAAVKNGTDTQFLTAVKDNDIYDWKPKTPTRIYYGDADVTVFPFNSTDAYTAMKAKGGNVEIFPLKGKDHSSALQDFLLGTLDFFGTKK